MKGENESGNNVGMCDSELKRENKEKNKINRKQQEKHKRVMPRVINVN